MSIEIIVILVGLVVGLFVILFWLNYKLYLRISGLESDVRIIRSQIKLNSETVKYDLALIVKYINEAHDKISKIEISKDSKIVSNEETSKKTLFDDLWKIEPPVKK